jgi:hypothetical protein
MPDIVPLLLNVSEGGSDSGIWFTDTYTPPVNKTIILVTNGVQVAVSPPPIIPAVIGNGVSWSLLASILYEHGGVDRARLSVFRGLTQAPTTGTTSVGYNRTMLRQSITVFEFSNTDIGNLGVNAIVGTPGQVEIASSSGLNPSLAVPAGEDLANSQIGILGYAEPNMSVSPGIGFVTLINNPTGEGGGHYLEMSQVVLPAVDFIVSSDPTFVIVALELRNATPAPPEGAAQVQGRPAFLSGNLIT